MNLSIATFGVILTAVFGGGAVTVALINAVVGRGGRRADVAAKITEAAGEFVEHFQGELKEVKKECAKCNARLAVTERRLEDSEEAHRHTKAALRALIRVVEANETNPTPATTEALSEAKHLV